MSPLSLFRAAGLLLLVAMLGACASTGQPSSTSQKTLAPPNPADPYESFNRSMYRFNKGVDSVLLRPVAKAYDTVVPSVLDRRIDSAIANVGDLPNFGNALLQGKLTPAFVSLGRVLINSTLGLAGLFDPATSMGLKRQPEDFGQTLATWGVKPGPFLMLPLFGPSTLRDAFARPVDSQLDPVTHIDHVRTRNTIKGLDLIDTRQRLFEIEPLLAESLDEYAFVRDAYLQRREYQVHDGAPPAKPAEDCDPAVDEC